MTHTCWDSSFLGSGVSNKAAMTLRREASAESIEEGGDVRTFLRDQQPKRTVYKLTPMESSPPLPLRRHDSAFFIQPSQETLRRQKVADPLPLPHFQKPQSFAKDMFNSPPLACKGAPVSASTPMPIPGKSVIGLERRASLIKAVQSQAYKAAPARSLASHAKALHQVPIPEGSWTGRQITFPDANVVRQPSKLNLRTAQVKMRVEAAKAAIRSKAATGPSGKEEAAEDLAWRMKFKRKWIREELYARKQNFPDDPGYTDAWGEALEFIEACGSQGAMQVAFLEGTSSEVSAHSELDMSDEEDLLNEATMFEDSQVPFHWEDSNCPATTASFNLSARAATLLRLHRQATAAALK